MKRNLLCCCCCVCGRYNLEQLPIVEPRATQQRENEGDCYAHAYGLVATLAWLAIPHVTPPTRDLLIHMIKIKFLVPESPVDVFNFIGNPQERLKDNSFQSLADELSKTDYYDLPALECKPLDLSERRKAGYSLFCWRMDSSRWDAFKEFYREPGRDTTFTASCWGTATPSASNLELSEHVVVVDWAWSTPRRLCLINSWGHHWGDRGRFYVENFDALEPVKAWLYDVVPRDRQPSTAVVVERRAQFMSVFWPKEMPQLPCEATNDLGLSLEEFHEVMDRKTAAKGSWQEKDCYVVRISAYNTHELHVRLQHRNIVEALGFRVVQFRHLNLASEDSASTIQVVDIVYESAPDGSLKDQIGQVRLSRDEKLRVLRDVSAAVAYLASKGYAHRNITPEHIVKHGDTWKLCSFSKMSIHSLDAPLSSPHPRWPWHQWIDPRCYEAAATSTSARLELDLHSLAKLIEYLQLDNEPKLLERCTAFVQAHRCLHWKPYENEETYRRRRLKTWLIRLACVVYVVANAVGAFLTLRVAFASTRANGHSCLPDQRVACIGGALLHVMNAMTAAYYAGKYEPYVPDGAQIRGATCSLEDSLLSEEPATSTPPPTATTRTLDDTEEWPLRRRCAWLCMRLVQVGVVGVQVGWTVGGVSLGSRPEYNNDDCAKQFRYAGVFILVHCTCVALGAANILLQKYLNCK